MRKLDMVIIAAALVAVVFVGGGYVNSERAAQQKVTVRSTVSNLSIQQLAHETAACDVSNGSASPESRKSYCAEVFRAMEARPLESVTVQTAQDPFIPSLPRPTLQEVPVPAPRLPADHSTKPNIY